MWQKINPHSMKIEVIRDWDSRWFPNPNLEEIQQHDDQKQPNIKVGQKSMRKRKKKKR